MMHECGLADKAVRGRRCRTRMRFFDVWSGFQDEAKAGGSATRARAGEPSRPPRWPIVAARVSSCKGWPSAATFGGSGLDRNFPEPPSLPPMGGRPGLKTYPHFHSKRRGATSLKARLELPTLK